MTPSTFRTLCLSMPGSHEEPHHQRTSFRVGGRIFATMTADGTEVMVPVKPVENCLELLASHPDVYIDYGGWTRRMGALGVRLAKVRSLDVAGLVLEAWLRLRPKRSRKA